MTRKTLIFSGAIWRKLARNNGHKSVIMYKGRILASRATEQLQNDCES